jgi:hypothetical protein
MATSIGHADGVPNSATPMACRYHCEPSATACRGRVDAMCPDCRQRWVMTRAPPRGNPVPVVRRLVGRRTSRRGSAAPTARHRRGGTSCGSCMRERYRQWATGGQVGTAEVGTPSACLVVFLRYNEGAELLSKQQKSPILCSSAVSVVFASGFSAAALTGILGSHSPRAHSDGRGARDVEQSPAQ